MASSPNQFLIPELNVSSSQNQIKELRRKMLANNYQEQIKSSPSKNRQIPNPEIKSTINYRDLNKIENEYLRGAKSQLAQNYRQQSERKANIKRIQRQRKIQQQRMVLQNLRKMHEEESIRSRELQIAFKRDAIQNLQKKQRQKHQQRERERIEKERYSQKLKNYSPELAEKKQNSFKKHFQQVNGIRQQIERNYLQKWQPQIRERDLQKDRMAYRGIIGNDERLRMNLLSEHEQSTKQKIVLRDSLQEQIQQKEKVKESSRIREKSEGYTSPTYHSRHHPINNPVDFKITHDNKYIINSLKSQSGSTMSGLARSGSHALLT